jgi:hypothetical protein
VRSNTRKPRVLLTIDGVSASIKEWADIAKVRESVIRRRWADCQAGRNYRTHAEVVYGVVKARSQGHTDAPELAYRRLLTQLAPQLVEHLLQDMAEMLRGRAEDFLLKKLGPYMQQAMNDSGPLEHPAAQPAQPTHQPTLTPPTSAPQPGQDPWWDKYNPTWELELQHGPYIPLPDYLHHTDLDATVPSLGIPLYVAWHMAATIQPRTPSDLEEFLDIKLSDYLLQKAA